MGLPGFTGLFRSLSMVARHYGTRGRGSRRGRRHIITEMGCVIRVLESGMNQSWKNTMVNKQLTTVNKVHKIENNQLNNVKKQLTKVTVNEDIHN